mmetsp:Transcript_8582/g.35378  ORF Transcript_8582/g.35378 Transcript_8582/m.35378 type:complete len:471 (-) Transcript_8582:189-1601(-)
MRFEPGEVAISPHERGVRGADVAGDLRHERVERAELALGPHEGREQHRHGLAVEVALLGVAVDEEGLDDLARVLGAREGRRVPDVRDGGAHGGVALDVRPARVDPRRDGAQRVAEEEVLGEVRRREAELLRAAAVAALHGAAQQQRLLERRVPAAHPRRLIITLLALQSPREQKRRLEARRSCWRHLLVNEVVVVVGGRRRRDDFGEVAHRVEGHGQVVRHDAGVASSQRVDVVGAERVPDDDDAARTHDLGRGLQRAALVVEVSEARVEDGAVERLSWLDLCRDIRRERRVGFRLAVARQPKLGKVDDVADPEGRPPRARLGNAERALGGVFAELGTARRDHVRREVDADDGSREPDALHQYAGATADVQNAPWPVFVRLKLGALDDRAQLAVDLARELAVALGRKRFSRLAREHAGLARVMRVPLGFFCFGRVDGGRGVVVFSGALERGVVRGVGRLGGSRGEDDARG